MSVKSMIYDWNEDTSVISDLSIIIAHPAYERIRLADRYIEWEKNCFVHTAAVELLRFLRRGEYNAGFFSLLEDITGEQPYNIHECATQSWLRWGVQKRYIADSTYEIPGDGEMIIGCIFDLVEKSHGPQLSDDYFRDEIINEYRRRTKDI